MGHILLDVALVVIGLGLVAAYARRGFFKSLIHSFKTIFALIAAYFFGGKLAEILNDTFIGKAVRGSVFEKVNSMYGQAAEGVNVEELSSSFPSFIMTDEVKAKLTDVEGNGEELVNSVTDAIASPIANVISTVIGYILVFVVALIALWIVAGLLDKLVEHIALLNIVNTVLGVVLGVVLTLLLLFAVGSVLKFFLADSDLYTKSTVLKFFGDSSFLQTFKFLDIGNLLG